MLTKQHNTFLSRLENLTTKVIGHIGVDAGIVWIGDPCYILHKDKLPSSLGNNWLEFCNKLGKEPSKSFTYDAGHEGLGVCTSTKYGDGTYPVIGFFNKGSDRPSLVLIDFDGEYQIEDNSEE